MGRSILVSRWKKIYGAIYEVGILDRKYIIRPLTESEFFELWGGAFSLERESRDFEATQTTVDYCVLYPDKVLDNIQDYEPGGIVDALCSAILEVSNFSNNREIETLLNQYRLEVAQTINIMKDYITAAGIGYSIKDLENLTLEKICELTAHAEQVVIFRQIQMQKALSGDQPHIIEFLTPKELKKRKIEQEMERLRPVVEQLAAQNLRRR